MFNQNLNYVWETFTQEFFGTGSINGKFTNGLCSGLIGQNDWQNTYNYYVVNLARRLPEENGVAKSIQILGNSLSTLAVDLFCFVVFEKSITIDLFDGSIVRTEM